MSTNNTGTPYNNNMNIDPTKTEGLVVVVDEVDQKPQLTATVQELKQLLSVIQNQIIPMTEQGVAQGNKVFGAAILNADNLTDKAFCATNTETECPLFHGEVKCIYEWSKATAAADRGPLAQRSVFLATHEPCCMCISSILWAGFTKIFYFFPYHITSAQGIPHDIRTMHELWGVNTYRKRNLYFSSACIMDLVSELPDGSVDKVELQTTIDGLLKKYNDMAEKYHSEKANNTDNSLVLG